MLKHKVNETRLRSLFKAITGRLIEILVDSLLIGSLFTFLGVPYAFQLASGIAILTEILCALTTYLNERIWNRLDWGREVEHIEE